ncbi:MAG: GDP-mannose 4,6-dehydratase, partial [Acidobacteria bacterium]|nr:GDP-mannose 4,6-dehydratase [Acidobacteriota bacterium]
MENLYANKNILITGISGFVGQNLAQQLLKMGAFVVGIVRDHPPYFSNKNLSIIVGSLENYLLMCRIVDQYHIDMCFHVAAQSIVSFAFKNPVETFESNIRGTWNILDACRRGNTVKGIVLASSDKAYGNSTHLPYTEEQILHGIYPYDASKVCVELLARSFHETYQFPIGITRCANIYGPMDFNFSRIIPGTICAILQGKEPEIMSDGKMVRDYIFVDDAVNGYLKLGAAIMEKRVCNETVNFGTGIPISVENLVKLITELSGTHLKYIVHGKDSGYEIKEQYMESSKAAALLGWRPEV